MADQSISQPSPSFEIVLCESIKEEVKTEEVETELIGPEDEAEIAVTVLVEPKEEVETVNMEAIGVAPWPFEFFSDENIGKNVHKNNAAVKDMMPKGRRGRPRTRGRSRPLERVTELRRRKARESDEQRQLRLQRDRETQRKLRQLRFNAQREQLLKDYSHMAPADLLRLHHNIGRRRIMKLLKPVRFNTSID